MKKEQQPPLMPKATAVWLVDNTSLTFKQIADFCGIHELEIKGIADGEVASGIQGLNPVTAGQLDEEEIKLSSKDPNRPLRIKVNAAVEEVQRKYKKRIAKYTPIARRQDKPDAVYWLVKNFPDMSDQEISKLVGMTKPTLQSIRNRTHWNIANIRARDPVLLGLCTQAEINKVIAKYNFVPSKVYLEGVNSPSEEYSTEEKYETSSMNNKDLFRQDLETLEGRINKGSKNTIDQDSLDQLFAPKKPRQD